MVEPAEPRSDSTPTWPRATRPLRLTAAQVEATRRPLCGSSPPRFGRRRSVETATRDRRPGAAWKLFFRPHRARLWSAQAPSPGSRTGSRKTLQNRSRPWPPSSSRHRRCRAATKRAQRLGAPSAEPPIWLPILVTRSRRSAAPEGAVTPQDHPAIATGGPSPWPHLRSRGDGALAAPPALTGSPPESSGRSPSRWHRVVAARPLRRLLPMPSGAKPPGRSVPHQFSAGSLERIAGSPSGAPSDGRRTRSLPPSEQSHQRGWGEACQPWRSEPR